MIHPYELHTDAYNFFFHPLHKDKLQNIALSVFVNIALSILTIGIWQIAFWTVNRLDNRKVEIWQSHNTPKIQSATVKFFASPSKRKIEKSGLIGHGTNTCFIASALQLCRQLPSVREALKNELQKNVEETKDKFEQRKKIQLFLQYAIETIEKGENIAGSEMSRFHEILHECYPQGISKPGRSGDVSLALDCLLSALSLSTNYIFSDARVREEESLPPILNNVVYSITNLKLEHTYIVEEDPSRKVTYRLAGVSCHGSGHATAHLKDLTFPSNEFILCDDMASQYEIEKAIKPNPRWPATQYLLVYSRVD